MKKFFLLNILFLLMMMSISNAQVRKIVLLEEATNASCPDCFTSNLKLQEFYKTHFGGVISLRYHADWPGDNDPMYLLNPSENNQRIHNYYGIFFVADYFMDGIDYGEPLDSLIMIDQMNHHLSSTAPVKIKINANIDADSVRATLRLIGVSPVSQTNLKFRAAIIERMVTFSSPPGTNGEKIFPDVMRKMLPDTNGYTVNSINPGDEITYYVSYPVNPAWKWQDLAVVAWLQTDENREIYFWQTTDHEIIQSNISIPTYRIECDEPLAEFLPANQNVSKTLKIINDNDVDLHIRLKVKEAQVPAGWNYNFIYNSISFDSVEVTITPGDSIAFGLSVSSNSSSGIIKLAIFAQNLDDPYNYGYTAHYLGVTKTENSNVLFIDDDGGGNSETCYFSAFDSTGIKYTSIEGGLVSGIMNQILPENFNAVFWDIGKRTRIVSRLDIDFLENYLNSGGNLFLSVSDPNFFFNFSFHKAFEDFMHKYLDAESYGYFGSNSLLVGIEGTVGAGISTNLEGSYRGLLGSYSGVSDSILQYTDYIYSQPFGGLSYDAGNYKTVILCVGLEQFVSASARQLLIQNVINWFNVPVGVNDKKNIIPVNYILEQNYPNPFNPSTKISWQLPVISRQTLKIFDVLGREVATLINEDKPAGTYEVIWDAKNFSSGVYFYQLKATPILPGGRQVGGQAGNFVETKKMLLIK